MFFEGCFLHIFPKRRDIMNYKVLVTCLVMGITLTGPSYGADFGDLLVSPDSLATGQDTVVDSSSPTDAIKDTTQQEQVIPDKKVSARKDSGITRNAVKTQQTGQTPAENKKKDTAADLVNQGDKKQDPAKELVSTIQTASDSKIASQLNALDSLTIPPLGPADFFIGNVRSGDTLQKVKRIFGTPSKYSQSNHYTETRYTDTDLDMRFILRNDTATILKQTIGERKGVRVGVDSVFLAKGKDVVMSRSIRLKSPAEVLVRQFGIPTDVLRDADANVYYFVYANPSGFDMLAFAIGDRKIERVALMPPRPPYVTGVVAPTKEQRLDRDFTLMGFAIEKPFQPNKYNMWNSLVKRHGNNFWLYGDYGVEVDRRNTVRKVFLLTNNAFTGRGATLGYHVSTILALYGHPDRVEIGPDADKSVDAYYYDSPFQKGVSLVFVLKHDTHYVDDVILTSTPISNLQDPMERYGLK
jgi:hypothetical protein